MPATKIDRRLYECRKCGWRWLGRKKPRPRRCGRLSCRSVFWNSPEIHQVPIAARILYKCPKCSNVWIGRTKKMPTRCGACLTAFPQPKIVNPQHRKVFRKPEGDTRAAS